MTQTGPPTNTPAAWLVEHAHLLPGSGNALDIACGTGRHALWLAEHGLTVRALDRDAAAVAALNAEATRRGVDVSAEVFDLERSGVSLGAGSADVIVAVHYLHRPLFPALVDALRVDGLLIYETFTRAQAARGKPTNPAFLLEPGELLTLAGPLEVVAVREGAVDGRELASIVARRVR